MMVITETTVPYSILFAQIIAQIMESATD